MQSKHPIYYGIISGVAILLVYIAIYSWDKSKIVQSSFFFFMYLVHIPFMMASGLKSRNLNGGLIDFRHALRAVFITFFIGMVVHTLIYYFLFNYDLELVEMQRELMKETFSQEEDKDAAKDLLKILEKDDLKVTIRDTFIFSAFSTFGGILLSFIVSLMVKR